jgi:hypothetical protein
MLHRECADTAQKRKDYIVACLMCQTDFMFCLVKVPCPSESEPFFGLLLVRKSGDPDAPVALKGSFLYALRDGAPLNASFRKFCEANDCDIKTVSEATLCLVKIPGSSGDSVAYESNLLCVTKMKRFSEFEGGGAFKDLLSVKEAFESI